MNSITFHPEAAAEVAEAAEFYEGRSPGLGLALLDEVERSLGQIAATPEAFPVLGKRARRMPLWRFPYSFWSMPFIRTEFASWRLPTRSDVLPTGEED